MPENITAAATPTLTLTLSVPLSGEDVAAAVCKNADQVHLNNAKAINTVATTGLAAAPTAVNLTADIRSLVTTSANVTTKGTLTAGDGGAGEWYYDATDTTTPDNIGTVVTAAAGGRWKRKIKNKVYTKWFGCKFDGVTDDFAGIQATIDAATALGVAVQGQRGTAIVGTTLTVYDKTHLRGFALGQTKIKRKSGAAIWLLKNQNFHTAPGNSDITIEEMVFDGSRTGTVDIPARWAVCISFATNVTVSNSIFTSADSDALCLEHCKNSKVIGCTATDSAKMGMYFSCCDFLTITNNICYGTAGAYWGMSCGAVWNSTFTGNIIHDNPQGGFVIGRDSRWNTITGNHLQGMTTASEALSLNYYAAYLATVNRPNGGLQDNTTLYSAYDNVFSSNTFNGAGGTIGRAVDMVNAHRNSFTNNIIGEMNDIAFRLLGCQDTLISGCKIFNTGKNPNTGQWAILGVPYNGVNCDRTTIVNTQIFDTQTVPTTFGIQITNAATTGCRIGNCSVRLASNQIYQDSTTAPILIWGTPLAASGAESFEIRAASSSKEGLKIIPRDDVTPTDPLILGMDASNSSQKFRIAKNGDYSILGNKVVSARNTGWGAMTGTATKTTLATATAAGIPIGTTYSQSELTTMRTYLIALSERMKALDDSMQPATGNGQIGP
jgi:Right handed beta helix region